MSTRSTSAGKPGSFNWRPETFTQILGTGTDRSGSRYQCWASSQARRSTHSLENLNREFRRRTKTQASFPNEDAAVTLLYGLIAFGQIRMRKVNGHQTLADLIQRQADQAA